MRKKLKINDIILSQDVFEMIWHERLWPIYNRIEVHQVYLETLNQINKKVPPFSFLSYNFKVF